jgi:hypothetical protein
MTTRKMACPHSNVASHGVEAGDPASHLKGLTGAHEAGWCRDCAEYVQRELDGVAWTRRASYEKGAWMWRSRGEPMNAAGTARARGLARSPITPPASANSESERVRAMNRYELCVNKQTLARGARYATVEQAKAAGRVAIEPTADEEEAAGNFIDLDSFFAIHTVSSDDGRDDDAIYDSRWPT